MKDEKHMTYLEKLMAARLLVIQRNPLKNV